MTRDVRQRIKALVDAVIAGREDAAYVRPVLTTMITVAINDFDRFYDVRHASNRIRDTEILLAWRKAQKQQKAKPPA